MNFYTNKRTVGFGLIGILFLFTALGVVGAASYKTFIQDKTEAQSEIFNAAEQEETPIRTNGEFEVTDTREEPKSENSQIVSDSLESAVFIQTTDSGERETITLAGGCFWCTEAFMQETPGVVSAISGYAGGASADANYKTVSTGKTAHREAVQVVFDPKRITTKEILDVYWTHINPTDAGGQFADRGTQYTTAIFFHSEEQRQIAVKSKSALEGSGLFNSPIVTLILPYTTFFEAEEYHQDYYKKAADHYERYKKASGRSGFIDDNWAKEAALLFLESN